MTSEPTSPVTSSAAPGAAGPQGSTSDASTPDFLEVPRPRGLRNNVRWGMVLLCSAAFMVNYIDRTTLSVALPYMSGDLHISPTVEGFLFAAFFIGYALCQLPAGSLIDRYGVKPLFAGGALIWGAVTMLTGLVRGPVELVLARLGLGVGEATAYPGSAKVVSRWFPRRERAFANSVWDNGSRVGAVVSLPLVTALIAWQGWRIAFVIAGALALVWTAGWLALYREPDKHRKLTPEERAYIEQDRAQQQAAASSTPAEKVRWRDLFRYRTVWAMMLGFFCLNYVIYFFITWFPSYLVKARGFDLLQLGVFGTIPGIVAIFGSLAGGIVSDSLLRRGWSLNRARKTCLAGGMLCSSVIALAVVVESAGLALALLAICYASVAFAAASVASLPADVAPQPAQVSSLAGIQNFASNIAGFIGPSLVGILLDISGGSYVVPLVLAGAVAVVGALTYAVGIRRVEPLRIGTGVNA
ncbi:MFS transporter [Goodfellowiella coeruleoviolacea]|uniref:D-galactonate transporter n=1 Tax=Goodfellowiella coeruleoviolacea TaxID=334858 RepID=A0AAE3KFJ8_9PSEU|nr:MFS transporter [Goodfellowiella coeruleoviolacea]MCP2165035.1 D-galactonate transporter [Goodfellowiella coeruleoviolacea]